MSDIQAPRRDEVALRDEVFELRVITFFEDIVKNINDIDTAIEDLTERIENIEALLVP